MIYTLKNQELTVQLSDQGAEIVSVRCAGNCEYIWQGDPAYWTGRAPLMFPICGRLFDGRYTYEGKTYSMGTHGFARLSTFAAEQVGEDFVRFTLRANEETKQMYPFDFELTVDYRLTGSRLDSRVTVCNSDTSVLPAAVGLHPAFNVPPADGQTSAFEDWYLEFEQPCSPDEILMSDTCFLTGRRRAYPLEEGKILRLNHDLFAVDAVFLSNVHRKVTLKSEKSPRFVTFSFPDLPYMGIWHKPRTDAPYVCIEPWRGLPAYDGEVDDLAEKSDMFHIQPKESVSVEYSILFG